MDSLTSLTQTSLAWLYWDPPKEAFTIPYFNIAVAWYGILFAAGFIAGYFILIPMLRRQFNDPEGTLSSSFADRITWFIVLGTVIGARLGHVFFYDWPYYSHNLLEIFMIRKGGLASHGGTLGVIAGLILFLRWNKHRYPPLSFVQLMDLLVVPTAMAVTFIRIANFFNQEILGNETAVPWAVIFGHAADGTAPAPRHPVQLYEAAAYLATFIILYALWRVKGNKLKPGILSGLFFIFVFGSRFFLEFFKTQQTSWLDDSEFQMGQLLSLPFVALGIVLLCLPRKWTEPSVVQPNKKV